MKMKKVLAMMLAVVLIVTATIAGTVAWLTAKTSDVVNTFTTSNIGVNLQETTTDYKMIPGHTIDKNPKAWIEAGSEAALLFVKVEKSDNFDTFMTYAIAEGWTELTSAAEGNSKVYYRVVGTDKMGETNAFPILLDNKVTVKENVTKEMMNAFDVDKDGTLSTDEKEALPTLTFTAYAHQLNKTTAAGDIFTAAEAWANLNT